MTTAQQAGVPFAPYRPLILGAGWRMVKDGYDGAAYEHQGGLRIIMSAAEELDGNVWLHLSASRAGRVPSYDDLCGIKRLFLGDRNAYQCFVPAAKHVNIHPNCLHLWARADGAAALPDFTRGGSSI